MRMTRRRFIGTAAMAFLAPGAGSAFAERYLDDTGLNRQSFIWQPTFAPSGPVTIVVSLSQKILHVFRGGRLLGIARCLPARTADKTPTGIYRINAGSPNGHALSWHGTPVHIINSEDPDPLILSGALSCIYVSPKFARLLNTAIGPDILFVIAAERTPMTLVRTFAPFTLDHAIGQTEAQTYDVAGFAFTRGSFGPDDDKQYHPTPMSIVISSFDRRARIVGPGNPTEVVEVNIKQSGQPLGTHTYSLTTPAMARSKATWLATGISGTVGAPQIADNLAQRSLERVSFVDPMVTADITNTLSPGASIVLTDSPLDEQTNAVPASPILLSAATQIPSVAEGKKKGEHITTKAEATPPAANGQSEKAAPTRVSQNSSKLGAGDQSSPRKSKRISKKIRTTIRERQPNEPLIGPKNFQDP
jgi:hypothetical protein